MQIQILQVFYKFACCVATTYKSCNAYWFFQIFVIVVTMIKQGYEDLLRHRADNGINNKLVTKVETLFNVTDDRAR